MYTIGGCKKLKRTFERIRECTTDNNDNDQTNHSTMKRHVAQMNKKVLAKGLWTSRDDLECNDNIMLTRSEVDNVTKSLLYRVHSFGICQSLRHIHSANL